MTKTGRLAARKRAQAIIVEHIDYVSRNYYPLDAELAPALRQQLARIKRMFAFKAKPRRGKP